MTMTSFPPGCGPVDKARPYQRYRLFYNSIGWRSNRGPLEHFQPWGQLDMAERKQSLDHMGAYGAREGS